MHFFKPPRFILFSPALLLALGVMAAAAPASSLTLAEALRRTEQGNPDLLAQGLSARAVAALKEQAGLRPNPRMGLELENFAGTGSAQGLDGSVATLQASQQFERGDKRAQRVALAGARSEVAQQAWTLQLMQLRQATAAAYVDVLIAARQVALAQRVLESTSVVAQTIDDAVAAGRESAAESARARAARVKARVALTRAQADHHNAERSLARLWGDPEPDFTLAAELPQTAALPDHANILAKLNAHARLDLQASKISSRRAALELQRAEAKSDLTVEGGVRFINEGSDAALVAAVSWPLPVRNQNQGNIKSAREELAAAQQTVAGIHNALRHDFETIWQDLTVAHTAAATLRQEALPAVKELVALTRQAHEQGQVPLIEVILAMRERVDLEYQILAAEAAYARALVQLDALTDPALPLTHALLSSS